MTPTTKHFTALDGLRGIAVLLVMLSHLSNFGYNLLFVDFSGIGKCGVYLFFVLSAFLLTYQFMEKGIASSFGVAALGNYFWRRSLRVLPLFYLVVIVSAFTTRYLSQYLLGHGLPFTIPSEELIPHLLLQAGVLVLWSIPVEFKFYFLLPLFAGCFLLTKKRGLWLDAIVSTVAIAAATYLYPPSSLRGGTIELGYFLPVFICGCFCASAVYKLPTASKYFPASLIAIVCLIATSLTIPSIFSAVFRPISPSYFHKSFILYGVLWSLFLYAVLRSKGWISRFLSTKPLIFMGRVSFSLYLLHFPILLITRKLAPGNYLAAWAAVLVILGVSYLSFRLIERPLSRIHLSDVVPGLRTKRTANSSV